MAITDVKEAIKETIKDHLNWDDRVIADNITVDVVDSTVKLFGEVPNYSSRMAAEEDARSVHGVSRVENNLKVKHPKSFFTPLDEEIRYAIENNFRFDNRLKKENISIDVDKGVVKINGNVDAFWKRDVVETYAYRVGGVVDVINNLTVELGNEYSDQNIVNDIENAIRRSGFINPDLISIQVQDGQVTLSGRVPSYVDRIRANELAQFTTGVVNVIDKLIVR